MPEPDQKIREILRKEISARLQSRGISDFSLDDARLEEIASSLEERIERELKRVEMDIRRRSEIRKRRKAEKEVEEYYLRLSLNLRLQHFVMLTSVLTLILTGLPLKFHDASLSHLIIGWLGGIQNSAIIHRIAATGLICVGVYHLLYTILSRQGRRDFILLLPRKQDLLDYIQQIKYYLGKTDEKARFGRFSYIEKFDYWAVYWGMVIMISSGSLLWFEGIALRVLPKFVLDIAKEAHSDEALLATLAIIIWHFYNVHLNPHKFPMSKTWITGKISKSEMIEEHALEYEELQRRRAIAAGGDDAGKAPSAAEEAQ
jgi:cytochrome b subunit of formate dehydrogenase